MKFNITLLLIIFSSLFSAFSQEIESVKGYYVDNKQVRHEGFFKSTSFQEAENLEFKPTEEALYIDLDEYDIKEYGSGTDFKFIKSKVSHDASMKGISLNREPTLINEVVFLNVLLEGKSSLYSYYDGNSTKYFYKNPVTGEFDQLIYKRYQKNIHAPIEENVKFKMQIFNDLKCNTITIDEINEIKYTKSSLIGIFKKINSCNESSIQLYENTNFKSVNFGFSIYGGVHMTSYSVDLGGEKPFKTKSESEITPLLGVEFSLRLPSNKLDFFLRAEVERFSGETSHVRQKPSVVSNKFKLESSFWNVMIGPRFKIGRQRKMFFDAAVGFNNAFNTKILSREIKSASTGYSELSTQESLFFSLGAGYKISNKFAVELRYISNRNIYEQVIMESKLSRLGVNVIYTVF